MFLESEGRKFEILFGAVDHNEKDGFMTELNEIMGDKEVFLLEAYWCDNTNKFSFTSSGAVNLPFDIAEKFI